MERERGFSLIQVLVALSVAAPMCLVLSVQQWSSMQALGRAHQRLVGLTLLEDVSERLWLGEADLTVPAPFQCHVQSGELRLEWSSSAGTHVLSRAL